MHRIVIGVGVLSAAVLAGSGLRPVDAGVAPDQPAYYTENVRPILVAHCAQCHLAMAHRGNLSLETKASTMKGGRDGVVIVPGDPKASLLVKLIRHEGPADDPMPMPPPPREKISDAEIATVEQWIKAGAAMPADPPAAP